ncbi:MAG: hypothetical protein GXY83_11275 [Rhodopirellula sp.]|nr:hypothetical protein [Rhodopirellula sp.]
MSKPTEAEIIEYAGECRRQYPDITKDELKALLKARFIDGRDPLAAAARYGGLGAVFTCGAISNPFDWLIGLPLVISGLVKLYGADPSGVQDMIDGAVAIVMEGG